MISRSSDASTAAPRLAISKGYCTTAFGQVHFWRTGEGPVLLLLHQASQSSREFLPIAAHLCDHFTLLALDYPGHGQSDDPDHELTVADYAAATLALLDELGLDRVNVCGHHSGGILAIKLAADHAERFAKVIVAGIGVRTDTAIKAVLERPMSRDLPIDTEGQFLTRTWQVYRELSSPGTGPETTFRFFLDGLAARSRPYDAHHAFMRWDRDPFLATIRLPTLLISGEHDSFAERPESLVDRVPGSRFVSIPGGGAFLFYEQPRQCAAVILDFLKASS